MAEREFTSAVETAIQQQALRPLMFYEGEFVAAGSPSEQPDYLRLWSGYGELSWDGKTWTGGGNLLEFSAIDETLSLQARGFVIRLSGMSSEVIAKALAYARQGRPGTVWLGFLDASGAVISDPYQVTRGKLDVPVIEADGASCRVSVQYESRLVDLERPRLLYYTPADQHIEYPSDLGFDGVTQIQLGVDIPWDP